MQIIDAHIHYNPDSPYFQEIAEAAGYENTGEGLRRAFEETGVVHGIVMGNHSLYPEDHQYPPFCSYCLGLDGRMLAQMNPKEALALAEENLRLDRCVGLKLYPGYSPYYVSDPMFAPFYKLAERYQKPVAIHMGATAGSEGGLKYSHPLTLDETASRFPHVSFVICHLGNPWIVDAAAVMDKNPNVSADLSGLLEGKQDIDQYLSKKSGYLEHIRTWLQYLDSYDRLLYGTDWPLAHEEDTIRLVQAVVPERHWEKVFYENACQIYPLPI